ncbi:hypothetical protein WA016_00521 [Myxococcus stipitatus]
MRCHGISSTGCAPRPAGWTGARCAARALEVRDVGAHHHGHIRGALHLEAALMPTHHPLLRTEAGGVQAVDELTREAQAPRELVAQAHAHLVPRVGDDARLRLVAVGAQVVDGTRELTQRSHRDVDASHRQRGVEAELQARIPLCATGPVLVEPVIEVRELELAIRREERIRLGALRNQRHGGGLRWSRGRCRLRGCNRSGSRGRGGGRGLGWCISGTRRLPRHGRGDAGRRGRSLPRASGVLRAGGRRGEHQGGTEQERRRNEARTSGHWRGAHSMLLILQTRVKIGSRGKARAYGASGLGGEAGPRQGLTTSSLPCRGRPPVASRRAGSRR